MSGRELGRVEVLARVKSKDLRVVDGAVLMRLSYRQTKRLWKRYREAGAAGGIAGLGGALRRAAGAVRGREEPVQARGQRPGAAARRRADHAVWAHVPEAGDRADRGLLAAGERAGGAGARDASGPAGEEAAATRDLEPGRGQPLFRAIIYLTNQAFPATILSERKCYERETENASTSHSILFG